MATNETKIVITAATAQAQASLKSFEGSFKSMIGVVGGALSVGAFAGLIRSAIDLQDELDDLSSKTGISARDLSGLKFAADQNGASLELVSKAVRELSVNMSSTPDKFAKLGINATTATGALTQIADIVASMPDGMKKTALLAELMGKKVGPEMADFLNQGGAAIGRYVERGKEIYGVTKESGAAAAKFKDQMAELEARTTGLGIAIATTLLPGLTETAAAMNKLASEGSPVLALWRGLAGMGKVPWDLLFPPEDLQKSVSSVNQLKELKRELSEIEERLKRTGGNGGAIGRWMHGSAEEQRDRSTILKNQISALEKYSAEMERRDKAAADKKIADKAAADKAAAAEFSAAATKKEREAAAKEYQRGDSIVGGLSTDFSNSAAKKQRELNSPLMSASEKQYADNLAAVTERAARAKEAIDALNLSDKDRTALTTQITVLTTAQIAEMEALRKQVDANNASWQYGAQMALRAYLDEANNVARQTEQMFTRAFSGMEDALANFVKTGKLDFSSFADSIISDIVRIQIRQMMAGVFSGGFGGGSEQTRMLAGQWDSFDGGGYTGSGSRSGGVDGKGGFVAILHPNETVIDHTRNLGGVGVSAGGGSGGNISFVVNVAANGATTTEGSKSELAGVGEKIGTAVRAVMLEEMRPGGMLAGAR